MLVVAAGYLFLLAPRLAAGAACNTPRRTIAQRGRNAQVETGLGLGVLAIVGVLGTLPPALHTEPGWPFPVRLDLATLTEGSRILLASLALAASAFAIAAVVA